MNELAAYLIGGTSLMHILINLVVICLILWLIFTYLVPLLPEPARVVAQVILVVILILWLASLVVGCTPGSYTVTTPHGGGTYHVPPNK